MNVLIISSCPDEGHGAEQILEQLLLSWKPHQGQLVLVTPPGSLIGQRAEDHNIETHYFRSNQNRMFVHLLEMVRIRKTLKTKQFDVIHAWTARDLPLLFCLKRSICTGTLHDHPEASFHSKPRRLITRLCANRLHVLVCVSQAVSDACRFHGYKCPLRVLQNGLKDSMGKHKPASSSTVRIGFLGMYADWKGFPVILPWIKNLQGRNIRWNLYGKPTPLNESLCGDLPSNVNLRGHCSPGTIWEEIDILVHASSEFDPFPTVLLECARGAKPCIASNLGGASEIVVEGETGFLFDPQHAREGLEALIRLKDSPELQHSMGQKARQRYEERFQDFHLTERYSQFWQSLAQSI